MRPKHVDVCFFYSPPQTNTPAQLTDSNARTTVASPCDGCVTATMTVATMKMNPTLPALVCRKLDYFFFLLRERHTFSVICKIQEYILENCMLHLQQGFLLLEDEDFKHITVLLRRLYQSVWVFLQDPQIQNNY